MGRIAALLDDHHTTLIRHLRKEIRAENKPEVPHIALHVGRYSAPPTDLGSALRTFAAEMPPLKVTSTGLGLFTGRQPTVYLAVNRSEALNTLHHNVWYALRDHARDPVDHYRPAHWIPHVTLGYPPNRRRLEQTVEALVSRSLVFTLTIDRLAVIDDAEVDVEVPLG
ncbi:MAG: 2'-5' RNA ligase family protein [Anaerolineae bacterium]